MNNKDRLVAQCATAAATPNFRPIAQAYLLAFGYEQHFKKQAMQGEIAFLIQAMKRLGFFNPYEFGVQLGSMLFVETGKELKYGQPILTHVAQKIWLHMDVKLPPEIDDYRRQIFRAYLMEHKREAGVASRMPSADLWETAGRSEQKHTHLNQGGKRWAT